VDLIKGYIYTKKVTPAKGDPTGRVSDRSKTGFAWPGPKHFVINSEVFNYLP